MVSVSPSDGTVMVTMTVEIILMRVIVLHQPVHLGSSFVVVTPLVVSRKLGSVMVMLTAMTRVMRGAALQPQVTNRRVQTQNSCVLTMNASTRAGSVMAKWIVLMDRMKQTVSAKMLVWQLELIVFYQRLI